MANLKTSIKQIESGQQVLSGLIESAAKTVNQEGLFIIDRLRGIDTDLKDIVESLRQCGSLSDELKEPAYLLD